MSGINSLFGYIQYPYDNKNISIFNDFSNSDLSPSVKKNIKESDDLVYLNNLNQEQIIEYLNDETISITFRQNDSGNDAILLPIYNINDSVKITYKHLNNVTIINKLYLNDIDDIRISPCFTGGCTIVNIRGNFNHLGYLDEFSKTHDIIEIINFNNLYHNITNLSFLFSNNNIFNQDISNWEVSNIVNMTGMFLYATSFNKSISNWNVQAVENMDFMFKGATKFNNGNDEIIEYDFCLLFSDNTQTIFNNTNYNVSSYTDFATGTRLLQKLDIVDIINFYRSLFTEVKQSITITFTKCGNDDNVYLPIHDVLDGGVKLFYINNNGCFEIKNKNINENNTKITPFFKENKTTVVIEGIFNHLGYVLVSDHDIKKFQDNKNYIENIIGFNGLSAITNLSCLFAYNELFNQDISDWILLNIVNMTGMFLGAISFNQNISSWVVSNVISMNFMFKDAINFNNGINGNGNEGRKSLLFYSKSDKTIFNNTNDNVSSYIGFSSGTRLVQNINIMDIFYFYQLLFKGIVRVHKPSISITFIKDDVNKVYLPINIIGNNEAIVFYIDNNGCFEIKKRNINSIKTEINPFFEENKTTVIIEGELNQLGYILNCDKKSI